MFDTIEQILVFWEEEVLAKHVLNACSSVPMSFVKGIFATDVAVLCRVKQS